MRRGIGVAYAWGAADLDSETARRALPILVAEVAESPGIARAVQQLRVLECDLASLTGRDRKDTRADQSLSRQLDQRGVAFLAHDRFVDGARLGGVHRLAAQLLVALPQ